MQLSQLRTFVAQAVARNRSTREATAQLKSQAAVHRQHATQLREQSASVIWELLVSLGVAVGTDEAPTPNLAVGGQMDMTGIQKAATEAIDRSRNTRQKTVLLTYISTGTRELSVTLRNASQLEVCCVRDHQAKLQSTVQQHPKPRQKKPVQNDRSIPS